MLLALSIQPAADLVATIIAIVTGILKEQYDKRVKQEFRWLHASYLNVRLPIGGNDVSTSFSAAALLTTYNYLTTCRFHVCSNDLPSGNTNLNGRDTHKETDDAAKSSNVFIYTCEGRRTGTQIL